MPVDLQLSATHTGNDPAEPIVDPRIDLLERQVEELGRQLREANLQAETREAEAFTRGQRDGYSQADSESGKRIACLKQSLAQAEAQFAARLETLEVLSLEVAQTALARIFGEDSHYSEMISQSVRHQLRQVDNAFVIRVRVSAEDFGDAAGMTELADQLPDLSLQIDPALQTGQCTIDLKLGQIEAGIADQWPRLAHLLETMAGEGIER
ncbi:FliH/SctL family protein [Croceicoccus estronivorus]|uniref:FliH/SctL family protein n=1 Tax=Croceicoccus estronivorus TaxID=1172626 RepID=UPI0012E8DFEA|nr:FliH/SctL family protein [Croceicoccus estronivorus]